MFFLRLRSLSTGSLPVLLLLLAWIIVSPLYFYSHALAEEKSLFYGRGIGGGGGFFSPVFSPYDENLLFVSCDMGGIYRSEDKGKNWKMLHWKDSPLQPDEAPLPIFLSKNRITWVSDYLYLSISEDAGRTWKQISSGPWRDVQTENRHPASLQITSFLPLNEQASSFLVSTKHGLWRGFGKQWEQESTKLVNFIQKVDSNIYALEDGSHLLKSSDQGLSFERIALPGKATALSGVTTDDGRSLLYLAVPEKGIFSSTDAGLTWTNISDEYSDIVRLYIPKGQTDIIYAMEKRTKSGHNMYKSVDGGENWESIFRMHGHQETFWQNINVQKSWLQTHLHWSYYFTKNGFAISPFDPETLLVTTQGEFFISKNGGESWETFFSEDLPPFEGDTVPRTKSIGLEVTSVWGYHVDPHDPKRHYIAYTDVGFARSLDEGKTWAWSGKGSPWNNTFYDIAFDPKIPGKMYAAASNLHDLPHFIAITAIYPEARVHQGGALVSTDYGQTWSVPYAKSAAKDKLPLQVCTTITIDTTSPPEKRTLYAGVYGESDDASGVYVSHDDGKTWKATPAQPGGYNRHIYKLRIHPMTGDLYALVTGLRAPNPHFHNKDEGGIWVSTDKGKSWNHMSKGSPLGHWATAMEFHPTDPKAIYVTSATPQGKKNGGLYFTRDNGKRWWNILPDKNIKRISGMKHGYDHWMSVAVHPQKHDLIFVGSSRTGLFFSTNGGKRWKHCKEFPFFNAQSISFNSNNMDEIIITTFGSGIWSASLKELLSKYNVSYDKL